MITVAFSPKALQAKLNEPFWRFSIDHINEARILPKSRIQSGEFRWAGMRPCFFEGFHRCLPALAGAGNNLIVEHIIETRARQQPCAFLQMARTLSRPETPSASTPLS